MEPIAYTVPNGLVERVIARIHREEARAQMRQKFLSGAAFCLSAVGVIWSGSWFFSQVSASGLDQFLYLVVSDGSHIAQYWNYFLTLVLELIPYMSLTAVLATLIGFFISLRFVLIQNQSSLRSAFITA